LRIAGAKYFPAAGRQQILVFVSAASFRHIAKPLSKSRWGVFERNGPVSRGKRAIVVAWREYRRSGCPCGNRRSRLPKIA
jgi:hypothetical protein